MIHHFLFILFFLGCSSEKSTTETNVQTPPEPLGVGLGYLADQVVKLELPENNRPPEQKTPEQWKVKGKWETLRSNKKVVEYAIRKPYRLVRYGEQKGNRLPGMVLTSKTLGQLKFKKQRRKKWEPTHTWGFKKNNLILRLPAGTPPPDDLQVQVPKAHKEELSRHFDTAGLDKKDFVFRMMSFHQNRGQGLFLPAPSTITFNVTVPMNGKLSTQAHVVRPAIQSGGKSNGASINVSLTHESSTSELGQYTVAAGKEKAIQIDLSKWAGKQVHLTFSTQTNGNPIYDYVFLQDPALYTPKTEPERVLFTLVDTLRADHLGTYGYQRNTSPNIDRFAKTAVVFEQARAPAPWTLPSSLAALYGRTPEAVSQHQHLGEMLNSQGWATCAVVSNSWLLGDEDLGAGWSEHWAEPQSPASTQAKKTKACLEQYPDRNVLLFLHMIDPHTPYTEGKEYKNRFVTNTPKDLDGRKIKQKLVKRVMKEATNETEKAQIRQYLIDRYDQNILAVDDAFESVLSLVGPNAIVVLTSDHGEEFFEHGVFEHGRNLYDEVMRVPMIIRSPRLTAGRVKAPVTLMDVVPTLLHQLGQPALSTPTEGVTGMDLTPVASGTEGAATALTKRPLALGRTLQAISHWGVLLKGRKWISSGNRELLFDLKSDPGEQKNIAKTPKAKLKQYPRLLSKALKRPVKKVLRVAGRSTQRTMPGKRSRMEVRHPSGFERAWTSYDPRDLYAQPILEKDGFVIPILDDKKTANEVFAMLPEGAPLSGLVVTRKTSNSEVTGAISDIPKKGRRILKVGDQKTGFVVDKTWQVIPPKSGGFVFSGEINDDLRALGYIE